MGKYYKSKDYIGQYLKKQRTQNIEGYIHGAYLDVACGENDLAKSYGGTGVDVVDYGADVVVESMTKLPFEDAQFDTISILASLNYFEAPVLALVELNRVLNANGKLIVTNTNASIMKVWHKFREPWAHKSGYSEKELRSMLDEAGFEVEHKKSFNLFLSYVLVIKKK